jgi:hypothetical protein
MAQLAEIDDADVRCATGASAAAAACSRHPSSSPDGPARALGRQSA